MESYNKDGYWIDDHKKWEYYKNNPKEYRKQKMFAYLWLFFLPIAGIPIADHCFNEMGLSMF